MSILLPAKTDTKTEIAKNDEHHAALANDPTIDSSKITPPSMPVTLNISTNSSTTSNTSTGGFGAPAAGGFGAPAAGGFGSPSTGGFGAPATGGFGSPSSGGFGSPSPGGFGGSSGGFGSPMGGAAMPMGGQMMPGMQSTQAQNLQSTGGALQEGGETTLKTDDKFGSFINSKWRPMMAVIYMITCFTDFVLFPILWSVLQSVSHGQVTSQWMPLTLQGAGLYHIAMGAVLGIAAYGRSKEKIAGAA
jgi:hypothetical protein